MLIETLNPSDQADGVSAGDGLPKFEGWLCRYLVIPLALRFISPIQALNMFLAEGHLVIRMCGLLSPEQMERRVLIPRIRGIEDHARNWSPSMVLEHLMLMGGRIRDTVIKLSGDGTPSMPTPIEPVRTGGAADARCLVTHYRAFVSHFVETLAKVAGIHHSTATLEHPWFGKLTAQKWIVLGALHQRIHRHQLERIMGA